MIRNFAYIFKNSNTELILWSGIIIIFLFQVFLFKISFISNIALIILIIHSLINRHGEYDIKLIGLIIIFTLSLLGIALINQNSIINILRFAIIIFCILTAYYVRISKYRTAIKILYVLATIFSTLIILAELYMLTLSSHDAGIIRHFFKSNNLGDIYFYHFYYKIQIKGTSILPFVYLSTYIYKTIRYLKYVRIICLIGLLIAGNFAYIVVVGVFLVYNYIISAKPKKAIIRCLVLLVVFCMIGGIISNWVKLTIEEKADVSNAIRIEQSRLLVRDLNESPLSLLFGQGIGNTLNISTHFRDYRGNMYFELQSLYFLNQLGIIPFVIFILFNVILSLKQIKLRNLLILYLFYITYAISNPYILDTTQVIVIISLLCFKECINDNRLHKQSNIRL